MKCRGFIEPGIQAILSSGLRPLNLSKVFQQNNFVILPEFFRRRIRATQLPVEMFVVPVAHNKYSAVKYYNKYLIGLFLPDFLAGNRVADITAIAT